MTEYISLYQALRVVIADLKRELDKHDKALKDKPLYGWSEQRHHDYHAARLAACHTALTWLQVRMMQIDPD